MAGISTYYRTKLFKKVLIKKCSPLNKFWICRHFFCTENLLKIQNFYRFFSGRFAFWRMRDLPWHSFNEIEHVQTSNPIANHLFNLTLHNAGKSILPTMTTLQLLLCNMFGGGGYTGEIGGSKSPQNISVYSVVLAGSS